MLLFPALVKKSNVTSVTYCYSRTLLPICASKHLSKFLQFKGHPRVLENLTLKGYMHDARNLAQWLSKNQTCHPALQLVATVAYHQEGQYEIDRDEALHLHFATTKWFSASTEKTIIEKATARIFNLQAWINFIKLQ